MLRFLLTVEIPTDTVFLQMTTSQTLSKLKRLKKRISLTHLYRLLTVLGIKPAGRSRPQLYPADTADRVAVHLGLVPAQPVAKAVKIKPIKTLVRIARTSKGAK
jgi:hypothetical protein